MQTDTWNNRTGLEVNSASFRAFVRLLLSLIFCVFLQLLFLGSQLNVSREDVWNTPWIEYLLLPRTHAHTCTHARTYTHTAHVLVHLSINGEEQKHTEAAPSFTEGVRFCTSVIASVLGRQRCRVQPFNESRTDTLTFSQAVVCPRLRAEDP